MAYANEVFYENGNEEIQSSKTQPVGYLSKWDICG